MQRFAKSYTVVYAFALPTLFNSVCKWIQTLHRRAGIQIYQKLYIANHR